MNFVVDRIENNIAVIELENREIINVPIAFFPVELKEGQKYQFILTELPKDESVENKFKNLFK